MKNKGITLLAGLLSLTLPACGQQVQYGKAPLILDEFNFGLDLDHFFQDESIFRWNNEEGFVVSSEEIIAEDDTIMTGYITYSTRSMSTDKPLAQYAGVQFEDLGLVSDWDDEKVLMVCGTSNYCSAGEVMKIIRQLKEEYGSVPELRKGGFAGDATLYLIYEQKDKFVQFGVILPDLDFIVWPESAEAQPVVLTESIEQSIEEKLGQNEENTSFLFITKPEMAAVMNAQNGRSGFLVNYRIGE